MLKTKKYKQGIISSNKILYLYKFRYMLQVKQFKSTTSLTVHFKMNKYMSNYSFKRRRKTEISIKIHNYIHTDFLLPFALNSQQKINYKIKLLCSLFRLDHLHLIKAIHLNPGLPQKISGQVLKVSLYLTAESPQAPCLSVRMLTTFSDQLSCRSWSRCLLLLSNDHTSSSSRLSAEYWAHSDLDRKKETSINIKRLRRGKPF